MMLTELTNVVVSNLIHASHLSLVEDAPVTRAVLERLISIVKYTGRKTKDIRFKEEWLVIVQFMELTRMRLPDRFNFEIDIPSTLPSTFINRSRYLSEIVLLVNNELEKTRYVFLKLQIAASHRPQITVMMVADEHRKIIQLEAPQ